MASQHDSASGTDGILLRHSLNTKQAVAILLLVLVVGIIGSVLELYLNWQSMREEFETDTQQTIEMVKGSASEAAFQINSELALGVVDGLLQRQTIAHVRMTDNFGDVLGQGSTEPLSTTGWLSERLFGDIVSYSVPLIYHASPAVSHEVGQLELMLNAQELTSRFVERARVNFYTGLLRAVVVSLSAMLLFYYLITRPLVRVSHGIAAVDPSEPGKGTIESHIGHDKDELGLLTRSFNKLLTEFQRGLEQRDTAQRELKKLTEGLEQLVEERTHELQVTLESLAREKDETEQAFSRLDEAHKELDRTNRLLVESIQYARRIQTALLPDKQALGGQLREIHVCWEPLHLVGGDYFWLENINGRSFMAIIDCTGHGVPGAFMTLVVASALDQILHKSHECRPAQVLLQLDDAVRARLRQDRPGSDSDDGLDAAICVWDPALSTVTFAGANLPLIYVQNKQAISIRGDRMSLGYRTQAVPESFQEHVVPVSEGMSFYMLTDGMHDHIGGERGRLLGRKRLTQVIEEHSDMPMAEQLSTIEAFLSQYRGQEPRRDDMTLIGFTPL
ncbi:PP2C family protein-serine/threonine phosphatase [Nitrincola sp. MINF-07-Sa-05]|uniref:PP2C family protein-serine/threonine phosphatase n=1 Tax=Nitrincola salilacus TaxID=3400273 RepID=UPI003917E4D1